MDTKVINGIRSLGIDMIKSAGTGHPGVVLSMAPTFYTLFGKHLNFNKEDGKWINRDRFVLSAGHASALLYSTLFYAGFPIEIEDLKKWRVRKGKLAGHPELNKQIGVEVTTGLLGEGFGTAVGIAIAQEYLQNVLNRDIINNYTYAFVSDGDLMEGISYEAASLAGELKLGHLIVLYDSNKVSLDGSTKGVFGEDIQKRFEAMGWHTETVMNAEDYITIDKTIEKVKMVTDKPSLIEIKSIIGIGTSIQGTNKVHSGPLSDEDMELVKDKMNMTKVPFHVSKDAITYFREMIDKRTSEVYNNWVSKYNSVIEYNESLKNVLISLEEKNKRINIKNLKINFDLNMKEDLRDTNNNLINVIAKLNPLLICGSADISTSTRVYLNDLKEFNSDKHGRNIKFGVRERAMASICNGLALSDLRPICSTFLAFSDYMKPSIRMTSLMNLPVTYIFTHDSIKIGPDGPTHEPVEQLGNLRSIPNMYVFRPGDVNELVSCWDIITNKKIPSSLVLCKEEKGIIPGTSIEGALKGAYIVKKEEGRLSGILIATGSELETAIQISEELKSRGLYIRVVSMPCMEIFNNQDKEYKESLLPIGAKTIVIEASNDSKWNEFVYNKKYLLTINDFGISALKEEVLEYFDYNLDSLVERVEKLLK